MSKKLLLDDLEPLFIEYEPDSDDDDEEIQIRRLPSTNECELCSKVGHKWQSCPFRQQMVERGKYTYGIGVPIVCKFCKGGHRKEECQIIKTSICPSCGLKGHLESVCNKIAIGPGGVVGKCTYKECKGKEKWGHWMVTCPKRKKDQGPFKFKEGEDPIQAYKEPDPKFLAKRKGKK